MPSRPTEADETTPLAVESPPVPENRARADRVAKQHLNASAVAQMGIRELERCLGFVRWRLEAGPKKRTIWLLVGGTQAPHVKPMPPHKEEEGVMHR
jgi:hypothetical protein